MKKLRLSSRARKAFRGSSGGFSMLEVVIAIALLGIIAISVLSALQTAALALITADKRATAESLARSQMEYVKYSAPYDPNNNPPVYYPDTDNIPDGYDIDDIVIEAVRLDPKNDGTDNDDGIQQITVIVKRDDQAVVTLEDYKREPKQ